MVGSQFVSDSQGSDRQPVCLTARAAGTSDFHDGERARGTRLCEAVGAWLPETPLRSDGIENDGARPGDDA